MIELDEQLMADAEKANHPIGDFLFRFRFWWDLMVNPGTPDNFWLFISCFDMEVAPWDRFLCDLKVAELLGGSSEKVKVPKRR
jgi:hypothetical protein